VTAVRWRVALLGAALLAVGCKPSTQPVAPEGVARVDVRFNPNVTQENIGDTICSPGWTRKVRPPTYVTNPVKDALIARLPAGFIRSRDAYELDHWMPLELGGAPARAENLVLELRVDYGGQAEVKDGEENALHRYVCGNVVLLPTLRAVRVSVLRLDAGRRVLLKRWPASRFP
jgi:hypothetical protein